MSGHWTADLKRKNNNPTRPGNEEKVVTLFNVSGSKRTVLPNITINSFKPSSSLPEKIIF